MIAGRRLGVKPPPYAPLYREVSHRSAIYYIDQEFQDPLR
jgi:hypothetical protein